jgi:hypothetical protein
LAKLLEPYGISSAKKRIGPKQTIWGYHKSSFSAAWDQYLPPIAEHPEHPEHDHPNVPNVPGVPGANETTGHGSGENS